MDCSLPGSSVHGIFQARMLEWVVLPFSRASSWPRDRTWVSRIAGRFFTVWATREAPNSDQAHLFLESLSLPPPTRPQYGWLSYEILSPLQLGGSFAVLGCSLKNDRVVSVHFQGKPFNIMIIQVYAPTSNTEEDEVERFYEDLQDFQN